MPVKMSKSATNVRTTPVVSFSAGKFIALLHAASFLAGRVDRREFACGSQVFSRGQVCFLWPPGLTQRTPRAQREGNISRGAGHVESGPQAPEN
jgi:hypothetical protein